LSAHAPAIAMPAVVQRRRNCQSTWRIKARHIGQALPS
jgi:hypothetical protein